MACCLAEVYLVSLIDEVEFKINFGSVCWSCLHCEALAIEKHRHTGAVCFPSAFSSSLHSSSLEGWHPMARLLSQ